MINWPKMAWCLVRFAVQPRSAKQSWRHACAPPRGKSAIRPNIAHRKIRSGTGHGGNAGTGGTKFRIRRDEFRHRGTFDAFGGRPRTRHLWRGKTRRGQIPDRRWDTRHPPALYADAQIELTSSCVNCAQHTKFAPVALVLL